METAAIITAVLAGFAGLITALITAHNAATKAQVETLCQIIDELREDNKAKGNLIQRLQRRIQQLVAELKRHGIRVPDEPVEPVEE